MFSKLRYDTIIVIHYKKRTMEYKNKSKNKWVVSLKIILLSILIADIPTTLQAQSPIPMLLGFVSEHEFETPFVDKNGKEVFSLPKGHSPVTTYPSGSEVAYPLGAPDLIRDQYKSVDAFQDGICVVKYEYNKHYWINEKGEVIRDFGSKYEMMSTLINGYFMAWEPIKGSYNAYWQIFLDKRGKNAFGEKKFKRAFPFSGGYAAVQLDNDEESWGFIDQSGKVAIRLSNLDGTVTDVGPYVNGRAKITLQKNGNELNSEVVIINENGEVVFNVNEKFADRQILSVDDYSEGLIPVTLARSTDIFKDVVWLDEKGDFAFKYESLDGFGDFHNNLSYIKEAWELDEERYAVKMTFIDSKGSIVSLKTPENQRVSDILEVENDFLVLSVRTVKGSFHSVYNRNDFRQTLITEDIILDAGDNRVVLWDKKTKTYSLNTFDGQKLWETPLEKRVFTKIEDALEHKDDVEIYELHNSSDFKNGLFQLKGLKHLYIKYTDLESLPIDLVQLADLESLNISLMPELKTIPHELANLKNLKSLKVSGCPEYQSGLEYIIEHLPSLKYVNLSNTNLAPNFQERMGKLKPELEIESYDFGIQIFEVEEPEEEHE